MTERNPNSDNQAAGGHTQGRLTLKISGSPWADAARLWAEGWGIVATVGLSPGQCSPHWDSAQRANARRLAACWNACDGVPTEVLEAQQAGGLPWRVADQIDRGVEHAALQRQNAEVLAALEGLVARCAFDGIPNDSLPAVEAARAAIARVKGGESASSWRPIETAWISVEERLPEDGQSVAFVVSCKNPNWDYLDGKVLGGIFRDEPYSGGFGVPGLTVEASHWMPLPAAPGSKGGEGQG